jgi:hypothetical protein
MSYEIHLVRRSRNGVCMPVALSLDRRLVKYVASHISRQRRALGRIDDEILQEIARDEERALQDALRCTN